MISTIFVIKMIFICFNRRQKIFKKKYINKKITVFFAKKDNLIKKNKNNFVRKQQKYLLDDICENSMKIIVKQPTINKYNITKLTVNL